jgi:rod shape-determining protein MreC
VVPVDGWWQRHGKFVQLALAVVLMITAISFVNREPTRIYWPQAVVRQVLLPVQGFVQGTIHRVIGVAEALAEIRTLHAENKRLKEELEHRNFVYNLLQEIRAENTRLTKLLNFQETIPEYDTVAARVAAREPGNWYNTVTINKGTKDGLAVNMPVITNQGLVGRITAVTSHQAEVLLLLDQRSAVGGIILTTRELGVVKGFAGEEESLRLLYLPRDAQVMAGDTVLTSGLGGIFPKGLFIGVVVEVKAEDYGLARYAVIEPAVDFDHLEEVLVIKKAPESDEAESEDAE